MVGQYLTDIGLNSYGWDLLIPLASLQWYLRGDHKNSVCHNSVIGSFVVEEGPLTQHE